MKNYLAELKSHYETLYSKSFVKFVIEDYTIFALPLIVFMSIIMPYLAYKAMTK